MNRAVTEAFQELPAGTTRTVRLEDFDYEGYRELTAFLGRPAVVDRAAFDDIVRSRPNSRPDRPKPTLADWSARDVAEFTQQIGTAAGEFGYEVDLAAAGRESRGAGPARLRRTDRPMRPPRRKPA